MNLYPKKQLALAFTLGIGLLSGCASSKKTEAVQPQPAPVVVVAKPTADPSPAQASIDMAAVGEMVYTNKCSTCHKLKQVEAYTQAEWTPILASMARKAKLSEQETAQVSAFVKSKAKS